MKNLLDDPDVLNLYKSIQSKKNYPEWLKSNNSKDIIILEDCNKDQLEDKYLYWEHTINYKKYADTEVQTSTKKFRPRRRSV